MQKLVTIALNAWVGLNISGSVKMMQHGEVEEHLAALLADGWRVVSMAQVGDTGGEGRTSGWLAVLLEKTPVTAEVVEERR
jgi:hypothetical protein